MRKQSTLFTSKAPLAELLRPRSVTDVVGEQDGLTYNEDASLILWGPPGVGKTSVARIIARSSKKQVIETSAVSTSGVEFKEIFRSTGSGLGVLLLVDEIHHLNKSQQDIFLPYVEDGRVTIIGTTTENPSFELRPALLSRCKIVVFKRLRPEDLDSLITRAESSLGSRLPLLAGARKALIKMADGDGRYLLNRVEEVIAAAPDHDLDESELMALVTSRPQLYDKDGEEHYNLISALHKSMRGSDPDAALYWFSRMILGGEDPKYLARRVIRCAVEDVGMADPNALSVAVAAYKTYTILGSPEGELAIAQAVVYMATAPKSNAVYMAYKRAMDSAKRNGSLPPPKHILNAPTDFMKGQGYSKGYIYDHDTKDAFSGQDYFPMERQTYYHPVSRGFEREIEKRLEWWKKLREAKATVGGK